MSPNEPKHKVGHDFYKSNQLNHVSHLTNQKNKIKLHCPYHPQLFYGGVRLLNLEESQCIDWLHITHLLVKNNTFNCILKLTPHLTIQYNTISYQL